MSETKGLIFIKNQIEKLRADLSSIKNSIPEMSEAEFFEVASKHARLQALENLCYILKGGA
jgi:hypothetical protein